MCNGNPGINNKQLKWNFVGCDLLSANITTGCEINMITQDDIREVQQNKINKIYTENNFTESITYFTMYSQ